ARGVSFAERLRRALLVAGVDRHEVHHETEVSRPADFHSFRRAFSTALGRAGGNEQTAMQLAGHADSRAHKRYLMTSDDPQAIPLAALPTATAIEGAHERDQVKIDLAALPTATAIERAHERDQVKIDLSKLGAGHGVRTRDPQLGKLEGRLKN